ncbi:MAG TPA: hypothetical protein VEX15_23675 [Nocardioidaceae bacterium]|nr:hypothetical protein [Nocardioidaceae bacterium]
MGIWSRIRSNADRAAVIAEYNTKIIQSRALFVAAVVTWGRAVATPIPDEIETKLMTGTAIKGMAKSVVGLSSKDPKEYVALAHKLLTHDAVQKWRKEHFDVKDDPIIYQFGGVGFQILSRKAGEPTYTAFTFADHDASWVLKRRDLIKAAPMPMGEEKVAKGAYQRVFDRVDVLARNCPRGQRAFAQFISDHPDDECARLHRSYDEAWENLPDKPAI